MKINKKGLAFDLIFAISTIILFVIFKNENIFFLANMIITVLTIIKCKFSFFSAKTFIIFYTLIPFFFKYNFNMYYGIFKYTDNINYFIANISILVYLLMWYIIFQNTNILKYEKEKFMKNLEIPKKIIYLFCIFAILVTLIRFPSLPFLSNYDRFKSLLPGNSWNHLAIVFLLFCINDLKNNKVVQFTYLFVLIWFFGHYERVDCIGIILLLVIKYFATHKLNKKSIIVLFTIGIITFSGLTSIEFIRSSNKVNIKQIVNKFFINSTASDVAYTFDRAITYTNNYELIKGKTYLSYIIEAIPFFEYSNSSINILNRTYHTVGGEFILNEPYMNFKLLGILFFFIVEIVVLYFILKKDSLYVTLSFYVIIFSIFRIVWYGISYIETSLLIYVPLLTIFVYLFKNWEKKYEKN